MSRYQPESMGTEKGKGDTKVMTYLSGMCSYCFNEKQITADKTQWLIHLAKHREDIIRTLCDVSDLCVFCAYSADFVDKRHAASHYRWEHKKSTLIEWALHRLPVIIVA